MITSHMTRCMMVNPYGTPPGTTAQWADWVAKRFFGQEPGGTNVVIFGVACTVGSIVGYLVQQFLLGTGIAKVLGKLKDAGKFAGLAGKLSDGLTAVKSTVGKAASVAKGAAKKLTRGAAEAVDDAVGEFGRLGVKLGCAGACELFIKKFEDAFGSGGLDRVMQARKKLDPENAAKLDYLMKQSVNNRFPHFRAGYKAELDRVVAHIDAGDVVKIEPKFLDPGSGRWIGPDAELAGNKFLDVKRWSTDYLRKHMDELVKKMNTYAAHYLGGGVVELVGGWTQDIIDGLRAALPPNIVVVPLFA
jgi:hypothetical protein